MLVTKCKYMFGSWVESVVHLLLLKSSISKLIIVTYLKTNFDSFIHFHPKIYSLTILLDTCEWEILQLTKHK